MQHRLRLNPTVLRVLLLLGLIALLMLIAVEPALAKGGGVGGGSSFSRGGGGGLSGGSGFGGGGGYYGGGYGGYGGGFGLPWLFLPFIGFGGGGGIGIVLIIVLFMFGRSFFSGLFRGGGGGGYVGGQPHHGKVTIAEMDVALLASASSVPQELHRLVASSDTSTRQGYADLVQDAALVVLRNKQYWYSAAIDSQVTDYDRAEAAYNQKTMAARQRLTYEAVTNVSGRVRTGTAPAATAAPPDSSGGGYIVVTLLAAVMAPLPKADGLDSSAVETYLRQLAGAPADALEAAEVVYVPDTGEEPLTNDELLAQFPSLTPI